MTKSNDKTAASASPRLNGGARAWSAMDAALAALAVIASIAVYLNTLQGEFVYDDDRQILRNEYIMRNDLIVEAMVSDVWAFKGGDAASSPYWRPAFIGWLIVNHRLFGFDPMFWHATNILLHALATFLTFGLARRMILQFSSPSGEGFGAKGYVGSSYLAGAAALIFAVHPVHVESVAWISGSPDLLMAIGMFGSLWYYVLLLEKPTAGKWIATLLLAALAMLSKETGIVTAGLLFVAAWMQHPGLKLLPRVMRAFRRTWPLFLLAAVYFTARAMVLQGARVGTDLYYSLSSAVWTAPSVAAFYLRQLFFPVEIGPGYPLRKVTVENIGLMNVFVPLLIVAAAALTLWWVIRKRPHLLLPLAILTLPLVPAFNVAGLHPEQIVRDRYLYVSALGFAIIVADLTAWIWQRARRVDWPKATRAALATAAALSVALAWRTVRYNPVWMTDFALWKRALETDDTSMLNHLQFGLMLLMDAQQRKDSVAPEQTETRLLEAKKHYDIALSNGKFRIGYLGRSDVLSELGLFDQAEADIREVMALLPEPDFDAYDRLANIYQRRQRHRDAEWTLREAREKIPYRYCTLTDKLAVVLYQQGRKQEALHELELARPRVKDEPIPDAAAVLYHLGMLQMELGRRAEAKEVLREYLDRSAHHAGAAAEHYRAEARAMLER